jgi:hypothetical protein
MQDQISKADNSFVWGDWDTETVRLDFDDTALDEVLLWSYRATFFFKLDGFIVLESSHKDYVVKEKRKIIFIFTKRSYHVVFNCPVDWSRNTHIRAWVALESGIESVRKYAIMQDIKETSTLRISKKDKKPIPKTIFRYGLQDKQIKKFLETRKLILSFLRKRKR